MIPDGYNLSVLLFTEVCRSLAISLHQAGGRANCRRWEHTIFRGLLLVITIPNASAYSIKDLGSWFIAISIHATNFRKCDHQLGQLKNDKRYKSTSRLRAPTAFESYFNTRDKKRLLPLSIVLSSVMPKPFYTTDKETVCSKIICRRLLYQCLSSNHTIIISTAYQAS